MNKLLKILLLIIFQICPTILYFLLIFPYYDEIPFCAKRIIIMNLLIIIMRIDRSFTILGFYLKRNQPDFQITLISFLLFLCDWIENSTCFIYDELNIYIDISIYIFYTILFSNLSSYILYIIWIFIIVGIRVFIGGESFSQTLSLHNLNILMKNQNGLNFHEISRLKKITYNSNDENKTCSICYTDFLNNEIMIELPKCSHLFHNQCILDWLQSHLLCPICRSNIRDALDREFPFLLQLNSQDSPRNDLSFLS